MYGPFEYPVMPIFLFGYTRKVSGYLNDKYFSRVGFYNTLIEIILWLVCMTYFPPIKINRIYHHVAGGTRESNPSVKRFAINDEAC